MKKRCKKGCQIGTTIGYLAYSSKLFIKAIMGPKILGGGGGASAPKPDGFRCLCSVEQVQNMFTVDSKEGIH